ncbi:DNA-binding transcriptional LysR family regulator [Kitasatospora sp. GAS204A]|uniref:LysR family transcriptional regulator n=1 Tax=unclassified Kitasatospora TaxID=2633591 RepID=UPI002474DECE|nr:LysR family transcriptional regulator [Kitasatospora sp. GAS204B]MDH6117063.1 DNA-binding transcriptional LysR family regulator [Kitasatospora sp. GAS204B]
MRLDIRHVRMILAIADERSITRAARRVGIPQPSLSAQLHRIEKELRMELFLREPRGVVLTEGASRLIPHLRAVDAGMSMLETTVENATHNEEASFLLGVGSTALFDTLADFPQPSGTRLQIVMSEPETLWPSLLNGLLHFAVTSELVETAERYHSAFRVATIHEEEVGVVLSPDHPMGDSQGLSLDDLRNDQWTAYPPGTTLHDTLVQSCRSVGFIPHIRYFATSEPGLGRILARKDSVSLGTPLFAASVGARWKSVGLPSVWRMVAAWNPSVLRPAVATGVIDHLRRQSMRTAANH